MVPAVSDSPLVAHLVKLQARAAARLLVDDCRGMHPPEWDASREIWVCTWCRKPLSLERRPRMVG